jgi:hypothetical protein
MTFLFSQRVSRALENGRIVVEIPELARRQIWGWLSAHDHSFPIARNPNETWVSNTSVLEETERELLIEYGWDHLPRPTDEQNSADGQDLRRFFLEAAGHYVFDVIQMSSQYLDKTEQEELRQKVNRVFELNDCLWRISDGEFFKLDLDFVGARLTETAHGALVTNGLAGAIDEFNKARQFLAAGEVREAINHAGHSFESVLKVMTGKTSGNADALIKELGHQGYFDDLPEAARGGFSSQVLKALPFVRNNFGGHGQGRDVIVIPPIYGELAVQLAAVFHNFLIAKHLERSPPAPAVEESDWDRDIPF